MTSFAHALLMPGVRLDRDARAEERLALTRARAPWTMGFCLFGGDAERVRALTERLEDAAGRSLRFASDMERGAGQQVRDLMTHPPLGVLGATADPHEVECLARAAAAEARSVGVDVLFAPVLDVRSEPRNPIVGARSFGADSARVASLGAAYCRGAIAGGAFPVGKHWPGHGATTADSHDARPVVEIDATTLRDRDQAPFRAAAAAGCRAFMTAHVAYPTLDPSGEIATFSRPLLDDARALVPDGDAPMILVSDALLMAGALGVGIDESEAARRALAAGIDVLLYPSEPERIAAHLFDVEAPRARALERSADAALERLRRTWGVRLATVPREDSRALGADLATRALCAVADRVAPTRSVLLVDDDGTLDAPVHGLALATRLAERGVRVRRCASRDGGLPGPATLDAETVVVLAEVRAWKGAAGVSAPLGAWLAALPPSMPRVALAPSPVDGVPTTIGHGPELELALADLLSGSA